MLVLDDRPKNRVFFTFSKLATARSMPCAVKRSPLSSFLVLVLKKLNAATTAATGKAIAPIAVAMPATPVVAPLSAVVRAVAPPDRPPLNNPLTTPLAPDIRPLPIVPNAPDAAPVAPDVAAPAAAGRADPPKPRDRRILFFSAIAIIWANMPLNVSIIDVAKPLKSPKPLLIQFPNASETLFMPPIRISALETPISSIVLTAPFMVLSKSSVASFASSIALEVPFPPANVSFTALNVWTVANP